MRKTLGILVGALTMVAAMALPAGAAPGHRPGGSTPHPGAPGHSPGGSAPHSGAPAPHPGGPGRPPGGPGDHRGGPGDHGGGPGDHRGDPGRHGRYGDHDGWHYYYGPGPYYGSPSYGPAYPPEACPDGGYYDADGTYWYWDPAADGYVACS